jgi:hypothetical protein
MHAYYERRRPTHDRVMPNLVIEVLSEVPHLAHAGEFLVG